MIKQELDTPALLVDLPRMEANLNRMASYFRNLPAKLRPHFKNHKCPDLAARQLAAGAIGITCATLREAECLVHHGVRSILIANEITDGAKIRRLVDLSRRADVIVSVDNEKTVDALARAAASRQVQVSVLVDVDVGLKRCGVPAGDPAVRLARFAVEKGLRVRGLMGYEGQIVRQLPGPEKEKAASAAMGPLVETADSLRKAGIVPEIVSVGGTGTYSISGRLPGVTEVQAGSYLLMDTDYRQCCTDFDLSLSVLTSVISKTPGDRIVVDSGLKSLSRERGLPSVKDLPGMTVRWLSAEHGVIGLDESAPPVEVGDKIELWVHYSDATVNLHDRMYGVRDGQVEEVLRIEG